MYQTKHLFRQNIFDIFILFLTKCITRTSGLKNTFKLDSIFLSLAQSIVSFYTSHWSLIVSSSSFYVVMRVLLVLLGILQIAYKAVEQLPLVAKSIILP